MKNTLIAIVASIITMTGFVNAGTAPVAKNPVITQSSEPLGITAKAFGASVIEDTDTYALGGGVSIEVPVFLDLNLEVVGSVFEDELYTAGLNALYYIPVSESFSVYAIGGGAYEFETDQWTVGAGAGVKYSLSTQLSLFADGVYNWTVENDSEDGVVVARVGVGFTF